jgi:hypothetical protein
MMDSGVPVIMMIVTKGTRVQGALEVGLLSVGRVLLGLCSFICCSTSMRASVVPVFYLWTMLQLAGVGIGFCLRWMGGATNGVGCGIEEGSQHNQEFVGESRLHISADKCRKMS